jgi:hypothetical protein
LSSFVLRVRMFFSSVLRAEERAGEEQTHSSLGRNGGYFAVPSGHG